MALSEDGCSPLSIQQMAYGESRPLAGALGCWVTGAWGARGEGKGGLLPRSPFRIRAGVCRSPQHCVGVGVVG